MKYIIDTNDLPNESDGLLISGDSPYVRVTVRDRNELEILDSDYVNKHFKELQDKAYKKGLEDSRKEGIYLHTEGGYSDMYTCSVCRNNLVPHMVVRFCPKCGAKITKMDNGISVVYPWDEQKNTTEICIGDEIHFSCGLHGIVTNINEKGYSVFSSNGETINLNKQGAEKTGRHFPQIKQLLEEMK